MSNSETKIDSSSSDHSSPVALVTASNQREDTQIVQQVLDPTEPINDGTQGDNNKKEYCMNSNTESINGGTQGDNDKKKKLGRPPTSLSQKKFMTLKLAHNSLNIGRQYLSVPFMRENGMTKLGLLTLVGRDGVKWQVNLRGERTALCLGMGWKEFVMANGLKTGEYFTLEFVWENGVHMLRLVNTESTSDKRQIGESSKAIEKEFSSTETCNINQTNKESNNKNKDERSSNTSSLVQNRLAILELVAGDVKAGKLYLPSQFVTAIGIKKLGKITLLGKDNMKCWGYLLSIKGDVDVGCGWGNFCEVNGVKKGDFFRLEFIKEEEDASPVFRVSPNSRD